MKPNLYYLLSLLTVLITGMATACGSVDTTPASTPTATSIQCYEWPRCKTDAREFWSNVNETQLRVELETFPVDATDDYGRTSFHYAAYYNENPAVIRLLIDKGANVNAIDEYGKTPLHEAVSYLNWRPDVSNLEVIRLLTDADADVNATDKDGETPLHEAVLYRDSEVIRLLLDNGADVNATDKDGKTVLYWAASASDYPEVIQLLLDNGADSADLIATDSDGKTPLHGGGRALWKIIDLEMLQLWLDNGADVNAASSSYTVLHYAAMHGANPGVIGLLLEHGADINARDAGGETPLDYGRRELWEIIDPEMLQLWLDSGADVNAVSSTGSTPLHRAVRFNPNPEVITLLIESGADINLVSRAGTACDLARTRTEEPLPADIMQQLCP